MCVYVCVLGEKKADVNVYQLFWKTNVKAKCLNKNFVLNDTLLTDSVCNSNGKIILVFGFMI